MSQFIPMPPTEGTRMQPRLEGLTHTYNAAQFLAQEGEYDLALRLLRTAIQKTHLDRQAGRTADVETDAARAETERQMMATYASYRLKLDEGRKPWVEAVARTAAISGIIALTFVVCFAFMMSRLDAFIASPVDKVVAVMDGEMKAELPRVTNRVLDIVPEISAQINREMQALSLRTSEYLEKKVDTALDQRIREIVDEKLNERQLRK